MSPALEQKIETLFAHRPIPGSTYRFQFNKNFTFDHARALVPYLHELGITHVYASPILWATPGSSHGYDICDHSQLNPELGKREAFEQLSATLQQHGMGLIVDIVPNHMGIDNDCNRWWMDVLENGPGSAYASYFDIEWSPVKPELANKVLIPVLEDQYGNVLESGKLELTYAGGEFYLMYAGRRFPLAPRTYSFVLNHPLEGLIAQLGDRSEHVQDLQSIITALSYLPPRTEQNPDRRAERQREKEVIKRRIAALTEQSAEVQAAIMQTVRTFNGQPGNRQSFDLLDQLIDQQAYRLAFWRVAAEEINYRRFFDINTMAAIRMELPAVFQSTHDFIFRLMAEGHLAGLRIDHPDGLWNPGAYFRVLQEQYVLYCLQREMGEAADTADLAETITTWVDSRLQQIPELSWPVYVLAEKILTETEPLPKDWAVAGTTGYDFMNLVNGLFVDRSNAPEFTRIYQQFADVPTNFRQLEYDSKKMIMRESLSSEINALAHRLERVSEKNRHYRDFTLNGLLSGLREIIACMSIYRTYTNETGNVSQRDRQFIEAAVREAKRRNPGVSQTLFNFLRDTLLLRNIDDFRPEDRPEVVAFVMKFQQITGPVMAKSVEDTSFYIYNRLVSLNEVGGSPAQFGVLLSHFHEATRKRLEQWPHTMLALSTHDTKRSEDLRARLNVLSEMPAMWEAALQHWRELNADKKIDIDGLLAPDSNDEYLIYQTLLGVWPFTFDESETDENWGEFCNRIVQYMAKATKEAKLHTSWTNANEEYDQAISDFVSHLVDRDNHNFLEAFLPLQKRVAYYGQFNSLSQTLLKLTCPGVPDTYRGTELWDFSLVDPDNRRTVDYDRNRALLDELKARSAQPECAELASELLENSSDGRIKLYLIYTLLNFRREHDRLFNEGEYIPLAAEGSKQNFVCAFLRRYEGLEVLTVVPRLIVGLTGGIEHPPVGEAVWEDTHLLLPSANTAYRNLFTGEVLPPAQTMPLTAIFNRFPVAFFTQHRG